MARDLQRILPCSCDGMCSPVSLSHLLHYAFQLLFHSYPLASDRRGGFVLINTTSQRTFLKDTATKRNIPIHAIGLSLYEALPGTTAEQIGNEVIRTQWL
jgi:hypothetical protein